MYQVQVEPLYLINNTAKVKGRHNKNDLPSNITVLHQLQLKLQIYT